MLMSLFLFEDEFINIVAISFTALILNELIMVALEITTWSVASYDVFFSVRVVTDSMLLTGIDGWSFLRSQHC